jgi:hypothetical protein
VAADNPGPFAGRRRAQAGSEGKTRARAVPGGCDRAVVAPARGDAGNGPIITQRNGGPELPDSQERIATWVQVITGLDLDDRGSVCAVDSATRREHRALLDKLGGQPTTASRWSLGTILLAPTRPSAPRP